jgi:hypothetical protein
VLSLQVLQVRVSIIIKGLLVVGLHSPGRGAASSYLSFSKQLLPRLLYLSYPVIAVQSRLCNSPRTPVSAHQPSYPRAPINPRTLVRRSLIHRQQQAPAYWKAILFRKTPMLEISTSTTSLFSKNRLGFLNAPTPDGVPVMTAVPAGMVVPVVWVACQQRWHTATADSPATPSFPTKGKGD